MSDLIKVPRNRYEQLLDIESRVDVVVERISHDKFLKTEDILWILGTDLACDLAEKIKREDEENYKKLLKEREDENISE